VNPLAEVFIILVNHVGLDSFSNPVMLDLLQMMINYSLVKSEFKDNLMQFLIAISERLASNSFTHEKLAYLLVSALESWYIPPEIEEQLAQSLIALSERSDLNSAAHEKIAVAFNTCFNLKMFCQAQWKD